MWGKSKKGRLKSYWEGSWIPDRWVCIKALSTAQINEKGYSLSFSPSLFLEVNIKRIRTENYEAISTVRRQSQQHKQNEI